MIGESMNLEEYKVQYAKYDKFTKVIELILQSALKKAKLPYRHIKGRAKDFDSLEKKLNKRELLTSHEIEKEIIDIAGCRVIFFLKDEVDAFIQSGIIYENFEVITAKVHYPTKDKNELYQGIHWVVKLTKDRCELPEYSEYIDLICEIQVHTLLQNAWSETSHDIIYKKKISTEKQSQIGKQLFKKIEEQFKTIMNDYLIPAEDEFQHLHNDYQKILKGHQIIEENISGKILENIDNNTRYDYLTDYKKYYVDLLEEEFPKHALEILGLLEKTWQVAKTTRDVPITTRFGIVQGKNISDICDCIFNVLPPLFLCECEKTFNFIISMYLTADNQELGTQVIDNLIRLTSYNLNVVNKYGLIYQKIILSQINKWKNGKLLTLSLLVIKVCNSVLAVTVESIKFTFDSFQIYDPSFLATEDLKEIRHTAFNLLKKLYIQVPNEGIKSNIFNVTYNATLPPIRGYDDNLLALLLVDCVQLIDFFITQIPTTDLQLLQSIENKIHFFYERSLGIKNRSDVSELVLIENEMLIQTALRFKIEVEKYTEYMIFKTLVGNDYVPSIAWTETMDFKEIAEYRENEVRKYIASFNINGINYWKKIISLCLSVISNDIATFFYFSLFLEQLAVIHPETAFSIMQDKTLKFNGFKINIISGALLSSKRDDALIFIEECIKQGIDLYEMAFILRASNIDNCQLIKNISKQAIRASSINTIIVILQISIIRGNTDAAYVDIFVSSIKHLIKIKNQDWVNGIYFLQQLDSFIACLDTKVIDLLLRALMLCNSIENNHEFILTSIAKIYPLKIITFLCQRISLKFDDFKHYFNAVPYRFFQLNTVLSKYSEDVIKEILLFCSNNPAISYRGANLVKAIYQKLTKDMQNKLLDLIRTGNYNTRCTVITILKQYNGEEIYELCKELTQYTYEKDIKSHIEELLLNTGVTDGMFGFVKFLETQEKIIELWLNDPNLLTKEFAENYLKRLKSRIAFEQRKAENETKILKRKYADDLE